VKSLRFAWLLIAAALATIALKAAAFVVTGSVGLLSDALESVVNLVAAFLALAMLSIAARPPDESHEYGHGKAEYFSSGVEGALIVFSAAGIAWVAIPRLIAPRALQQIDVGLAAALIASLINLGVARVLLKAGREQRSAALEASARHLMTDFWTSVAVLGGVVTVSVTGWERMDPLLALMVAGNIVRTGFQLLRESALGLMDASLPAADREAITAVLEAYAPRSVQYHALLTRMAGARKFASVHVLVPGSWTVQQGHELLEEIEADILGAVPGIHILTHLEPREDPAAFEDMRLDRANHGDQVTDLRG
jgi:cation diffusion facilitator family transporter